MPGFLTAFFQRYLEIVPTGISKGFAVRWMCDFLQIPIENSVSAGDAQNDIAMLEAAHIGAVMCNAFFRVFAEHETTSRPLITIMTESRRSFINLSWMTE